MLRFARVILLGLTAATAAALSACSPSLPKTVPVQGKVTLNKGEPLAKVTIQFIPVSESDSFIANATTDENGMFQLQTYFGSKQVKLDGAIPGEYRVVVTPYPRGQRIAKNYGSSATTPLHVEIPESGVTNLTLDVFPGP